MGLFNRRAAPADVNTANAVGPNGHNTTTTTNEKKPGLFSRGRRNRTSTTTTGHHHDGITSHNQRPKFGTWFKATALDILTMIIMGAIGLGVYEADPAPSRSFPVTFSNGEIVYPDFAYPLRNEIIPIWAAALMAALIPIFIFLVMQIRVRSFWDVNNAVIGLLYALITAAVFQVFVKWLIGGLRPHFLAVCNPSIPEGLVPTGNVANGFSQIMFDRSICTGDKNQINDSLESMPSGHTTAAFAGFVYLYLYLNAKLKVFSNYHPAMWKLVVIYAPILGACLIGGSLSIDEYHNWYDILAGAIIGTVMAFSAYRMVYAAIWDFRFNHIPLVRGVPFDYSTGGAFDSFDSAIFTRKAGWGGSSHSHHNASKHGAANGRGTHGGVLGNHNHNTYDDTTHTGAVAGTGLGNHNHGHHNEYPENTNHGFTGHNHGADYQHNLPESQGYTNTTTTTTTSPPHRHSIGRRPVGGTRTGDQIV